MKNFAKFRDVFLSVAVCLVMFFGMMLFVGCGNKYEGMTIRLSHEVVTLNIEDGVCQPQSVIATVEGDASISRDLNVSTDAKQLTLDVSTNDQGETIISVSASAVCTNAVVKVMSWEGGKTATFLVNVVVPVKMITSSTNFGEFFVVKGQPKHLSAQKLISYEPASTTQKEVNFELVSDSQDVAIQNGMLIVDSDYSAEKVLVKATSPNLSASEVILEFDVLPELSASTVVMQSIKYINSELEPVYQAGGEQSLPNLIELSNNLSEKQSLEFVLDINSTRPVTVTPYIKRTLAQSSSIISFSTGQKNEVRDAGGALLSTQYTFSLSSENAVGEEKIYFVVRYVDFDFAYTTSEFDVAVKDSVNKLQMFVDDALSNQTEFTVYDFYQDKKGLKLSFKVLPITVSAEEKVLVLELGINGAAYKYWTDDNDEPINDLFINGRYEFTDDKSIYISANYFNELPAQIKIYAKQNPAVKQTVNIKAGAGTTEMNFVNASEVITGADDKMVYYYNLSSNQEMAQDIKFTCDTSDISSLTVEITGDTIAVDTVPVAKDNYFQFTIHSVVGKEGTSTIKLRQSNGYSVEAQVRVIYELDPDEISFSAPSPQTNSAVGLMERQSGADWEFRVAITYGNSITLTRNGGGVLSVSYRFADMLLADTDMTEYQNYFFETENVLKSLNFLNTSNVLDSRFLALDQIKPKAVGQVWVEATVQGQKLLQNIVNGETVYTLVESSTICYFLVEGYVPVSNLYLSTYYISLLSQSSVGYEDYEKTSAQVELNFSDATYQNITWLNLADVYQVRGRDVYAVEMTPDKRQLTITAFSTWELENNLPVLKDSIEFVFTVLVKEFNKEYRLALHLTITKAVQVEKIVALDANTESGIYIPLTYDGNDITRKITGVVQVGESGKMPYNTNLVYEFLPYITSQSTSVRIDSKTGVLTILGSAKSGDAGIIRIAPADRYNKFNQYEPGQEDVAVYIKLAVADGASRATSYRITSLADILDLTQNQEQRSRFHFTLINDIVVNDVDCIATNSAISNSFFGGFYGAIEGEDKIATITTTKTLFGVLENGAVVEDLLINGQVTGAGFVAEENKGTIKNVNVVSINQTNMYSTHSAIFPFTTTNAVGGLVGVNSGSILNSGFTGQIMGEQLTDIYNVGGLVGENRGAIDGCFVEFYTYFNAVNPLASSEHGRFSVGGAVLGGLVGTQVAGTLKNSYIQSYVPIAVASQLLITTGVCGVLVGSVYGGLIDVCFGYVQNQQDVFGSFNIGTNQNIKNAYITYKTADDTAPYGKFYYNYQLIEYFGDPITLRPIVANDVWDTTTTPPTFVNLKVKLPITEIAEVFDQTLENVISQNNNGASTGLMFMYSTEESLSMQEKFVLDNMNYYSFTTLFGAETYGIQAFSNNSAVIKTTSQGLQLTGQGLAEVTFYSKYNAEISRTYQIYVIYPVLEPLFDIGSVQFENGYILNIKATEGCGFALIVDPAMLLDARKVVINASDFEMEFNNAAIVGGGKGPFSVNTDALIIGNTDIEYNLNVLGTGFDVEVNELLGNKFLGCFTINMYKGADVLQIGTSKIEAEPFDKTILDVTIFSDVSLAEGEGLEVVLQPNQAFPEDLFEEYLIECVGVTYYADEDMQTVLPSDVGAKYFAYNYTVKFVIKQEYRALNFGQTSFMFVLSAKSANQNNNLYGLNTVEQTFELVINSQEILSVSANHYDRTNKSVLFDEENQENFVFYEFDTRTPNNIVAPGEEGMLKVDLYPSYAKYDYIDITYQTTIGTDYPLTLSLMKQVVNPSNLVVGYRQVSENVMLLDNGIRILNNFEFDQGTVTTLYIGTYLPLTIDRDLVFEIILSAYNEDTLAKESSFNLVVEYMDDAVIQVVDSLGQEVRAISRGDSANLLITLPKEQTLTLDFVNIIGVKASTENGAQITLSRTQIIEDVNSLTRTYRYGISVGNKVEIENDANYITIEVTISWIVNGKIQKKVSTYSVAIVDFQIENITLLTDKQDKTTFYSYIGVQSAMQFDFDGNGNQSTNSSFQSFLESYYFQSLSQVSDYGDYIINVGHQGVSSFLGNLYYVNGDTSYPLLNDDGTYEINNYFGFTENNGTILLTGKRQGEVNLRFVIDVQYPGVTSTVLVQKTFDFVVSVMPFSDEDLPLIIDNQNAFLDALNAGTPQDYILMSDIYLHDYTPLSTASLLSLDGNNYTIHIMSWAQNQTAATQTFALFDDVADTTTLKNLTVNLYHAGQIAINTDVVAEVEIAGLAITNDGIIYNSSVVAYQDQISYVNASGIIVDFADYVGQDIKANVAGFVLNNNGYITNSRVGGKELEKVQTGIIPLETFAISSQGTISGFVGTNAGTIASSYVANTTLTNSTIGGIQTTTSGFVGYNSGSITGSYVKGTGENAFSLTGQGITTSSISAGFVGQNNGQIADSYSNILLATKTSVGLEEYQTGRLSAGFVYQNQGTITNGFTASKIQNAKSTQMAFVGVDDSGNLLNSGSITHSYYYNDEALEGDAYSTASSNLNIVRVDEPNNPDKFYGFSFADSASSVNGVWFSTGYGIDLVSANQIAVSSRYVANEKRDEITGELLSYNLPYYDGYEYGSVKNPIIIRTAQEFNRVLGGDDQNAGTAISSYYNLTENTVFGNYRLISDINLQELNPDNTQSVSIKSTQMTLVGGVIDGNDMTIYGVDITSQTDSLIQNFGLFTSLKEAACIKNINVSLIAVSAKQARFVGALAGTVEDSKLINITIQNANTNQDANILGNNVVGGVVGLVKGDSQIKNITVVNLSIKANALATGTNQSYNRNLSNLGVINSGISYAGGMIGVADIYTESERTSLYHKMDSSVANLSNLAVSGDIQVRASTVGGVIGYLGPQSNLRDTSLTIGPSNLSKLVAYNFYAGGIVGECLGNIDMATTQHDALTQKQIEDAVSEYYRNPSSDTIERGYLRLFDDTSDGNIISTYIPQAVGGIVGTLITGDIMHSYSKINVRNQTATFAGGIVGQIAGTSTPNADRNRISLFEVYAFGDVFAGAEDGATGGIVGFVDVQRKVSMAKVNAVNYWSLAYDEKEDEYYLPESIYEIYAQTSNTDGTRVFVDQIVDYNLAENSVTVKDGYKLPQITSTNNNDDMFAITAVKFNNKGEKTNHYLKQSFACLMGDAPYNMVFDPYYGLQDDQKTSTTFVSTQSVTPYYDLTDVATNGIGMDTYFIQANWDTNYWVRYSSTNDLLPSLVTYSESMSYYIDVAEDLQKMIYHPYATFIVRALNQPSTIIPVGAYIESTGLSLNNFAGTLKGLDESQNYGFDFQNRASFIKATTGASFYSLTIKNLGNATTPTDLNQAFVDTATLTSFENMTIKNSYATTLISENNYNIGLLANKMVGGYLNDISIENSVVNATVKAGIQSQNIEAINLGMVCGQLESNSSNLVQINDVCVYQTPGTSWQNNGNNNLKLNVNGQDLSGVEVNIGAIMGETLGNVVSSYSSASTKGVLTKGIGVASSETIKYTAGSAIGSQTNGTLITLSGSGTVKEFNAGVMFGKVNTMRVAFNRTSQSQKLQVVGGVNQLGDVLGNFATVNYANIGGVIGKVMTTASVQNSSTSRHKFIEIDANLNANAKEVNAGMLIGSSASIYTIDNIDTFGQINVNAEIEGKVGGYVGTVNSNLSITNSICQTDIRFTGAKGFVGGMVGLYSAQNGALEIGDSDFDTKYIGDISVRCDEIAVGGILGASKAETPSVAVVVNIKNAVYGGNILLSEMTGNIYAGGIVGTTKANGSESSPKVEIANCLAYGEIELMYDYLEQQGLGISVYVGGLVGKGSDRTIISGNASLVTLASKTSATLDGVYINALMGDANGAQKGAEHGDNYYSHQVSLCLDLNGDIGATNLYYKRTDSTLAEDDAKRTLALYDVIQAYATQMTETEKLEEFYVGSKLNPMTIESFDDLYLKQSLISGQKENGKKQFVLFTKAMEGTLSPINVVNCHIMGDGYNIILHNALFANIDSDSSIAGMSIIPSIYNGLPTDTGESSTALGGLANVNNGFVFGCTVKTLDISDHDHISLYNNSTAFVGGVVGYNNGTIMDCMSSINITAGGKGGGVAGYNTGNIISCYSVGKVQGGYAFSSGSGVVYSSYTASPATRGVFGTNQRIVDSFYDLYAVGQKDVVATTTDTQTFAVLDAIDNKQLIFENQSNAQKFGYVLGQNFGYPTFSGPAYNTLAYMQGIATGTGTKADPILVNSIGKLQQITYANTKNLAYELVADIEGTTAMKSMFDIMKNEDVTYFDKTFQVADWKPIADFEGSITGQYGEIDTEIYSIKNLTTTNQEGSWAIFGEVKNAEFVGINVEFGNLQINASTLSALATSIDGVKIENVNVLATAITTLAVNSVSVGGLVGKVLATSEDNNISNCNINISTISTYNDVTGAVMGGLTAEMMDATAQTDISDITFNNAISFSTTSNGQTTVGGLVGKAQTLNLERVTLSGVNISSLGVGNTSAGGVFGQSQSLGSDYKALSVGDVVITSKSSGSDNNFGGLVGNAKTSTFNNVQDTPISVGRTTIIMDGVGKLCAGGIAGKTDNTIISNLITGTTITNNQTGQNHIGLVVGDMKGGKIVSNNFEVDKLAVNLLNESSSAENRLGGIVGSANGNAQIAGASGNFSITKSFALDNKGKGISFVGGIAGTIEGASVENGSISSLQLEGEKVGAVAGYINDGTLTNITVSNCKITGKFFGSGTTLSAYAGSLSGQIEGTSVLDTVKVESGTVTTTTVPSSTTPISNLGGFAGTFSGEIKGTSSSSAAVTIITGGNAGGLIGATTAEANLTSVTSSGTVKALLGKDQCGKQPLYVGGLAGKFNGKMTTCSKTGSVSTNAPSYVGGLVGQAVATFTGNTFAGSVDEQTTYTVMANPTNTAVGGLVGFANSSTFANNEVLPGATVSGTYIVGGLIGEATGSTIGSSGTNKNNANVNAGTNIPNEEFYALQTYAGGIVGKITSGTITNVENNGIIKSGWNQKGKQLTTRDFFWCATDEIDDEGADQAYTLEKLANKTAEINQKSIGTAQSYAGGICGNAVSGVAINNAVNNAYVAAIAEVKLTIDTSSQYSYFYTSFDAYCHYAYETENAYAAGIVPSKINVSNCTNNGLVEGGEKVEFNMFSHDHGNSTNYYSTYALNYGFDYTNDGTQTNIFNSFESLYKDNTNAADAWLEKQSEVKLVASNQGTNDYYYWGDEGYPADSNSPDDEGTVVSKTAFLTEDEYNALQDQNYNMNQLQYTYLHSTALPSGNVNYQPYKYPAGVPYGEVQDGHYVPAYYFSYQVFEPGPALVETTRLYLNELYYTVFCDTELDTETAWRIVGEGEEQTQEEYTINITINNYFWFEPTISNGILTYEYKGVTETIRDDPYGSTSGTDYGGQEALYESIVVQALADQNNKIRVYIDNYVAPYEGGPCTFPPSDEVATEMYTFDLVDGGLLYFGGDTTKTFKLVGYGFKLIAGLNVFGEANDAANYFETVDYTPDAEAGQQYEEVIWTESEYGYTEEDLGKKKWIFNMSGVQPFVMHYEGEKMYITIGGAMFETKYYIQKVGATTEAEKYNYVEAASGYVAVAEDGSAEYTGGIEIERRVVETEST